jgi:hypothetical protein
MAATAPMVELTMPKMPIASPLRKREFAASRTRPVKSGSFTRESHTEEDNIPKPNKDQRPPVSTALKLNCVAAKAGNKKTKAADPIL